MGFTGKNPVHPVIQSKFLIALSKVNRLLFNKEGRNIFPCFPAFLIEKLIHRVARASQMELPLRNFDQNFAKKT